MKTLILNGSPHSSGNTSSLVNVLLTELLGEYKLINAYYSNIAPCIDCRGCKKAVGCVVKDGMTEVYDYIDGCENIIIASPIYFGELTPPILSIGSRLQAYYCAYGISMSKPTSNHKRGGIILTGGGSSGGSENAVKTAKILLKQMGVNEISEPVCSLNTDKISASSDKNAIKNVSKLNAFLKGI